VEIVCSYDAIVVIVQSFGPQIKGAATRLRTPKAVKHGKEATSYG
jgi:hypothetical protein